MGKRVSTFDFSTKNDLYAAYMPFLANGGVFIATKEPFQLGEEVGLNIRILDELERFELDGLVAWLTPLGAQGGKPAGIGIQFQGDMGSVLRNKIETQLAGKLQSTYSTNTM